MEPAGAEALLPGYRSSTTSGTAVDGVVDATLKRERRARIDRYIPAAMASTILARCTWNQGKEPLWAVVCSAPASRRAIVNFSGRRPRIGRPPMLSEPIVSIAGPTNSLQEL